MNKMTVPRAQGQLRHYCFILMQVIYMWLCIKASYNAVVLRASLRSCRRCRNWIIIIITNNVINLVQLQLAWASLIKKEELIKVLYSVHVCHYHITSCLPYIDQKHHAYTLTLCTQYRRVFYHSHMEDSRDQCMLMLCSKKELHLYYCHYQL